MAVPIFQVDSFTDEPFHGNPAGVCLLPADTAAANMQAVAAEMNLSETAFLVQHAENDFAIRWFTPTVEVPLCGHATLASAHVLWEEQRAARDMPITFRPRAGLLAAQRDGEWIRLDFPAFSIAEVPVPTGLDHALGCQPRSVHRAELPAFLVELESEKLVRKLRPDINRLRASEFNRCIVTARSASGTCDFVSRFFAPGLGIDEDPVTGAAHCCLGPYWAPRLGKSELVGHQVSQRGGTVKVRLHGERVHLLGQAVTVIRGDLLWRS